MAEELWLSYFNRYLFDRGIISERERNRMTALIAQRKSHMPTSRAESSAR